MRDSRERLIGLLLLGEKKSEEPYTSADRRLLHAVAAQLGLAFDLLWLKERIEREQQLRSNAVAILDGHSLNLVRECQECGLCADSGAATCPSDGSAMATVLLVERVVDGKYRLDRRIGRGAYGAVYEAWDLRLKRHVALKIVLRSPGAGKAAARRFELEAQAAARLNHRNIVDVYDFGAARPDSACLAMELLRGSTWRMELRRCGVLEPQLAAAWLDQLSEGVAAAHEQGVIHRDLKPENALIVSLEKPPGLVKILDFGLAKLRFLDLNDAESLTIAGAVIGTLGYMSPEQFSGKEVDERTDIFSLGIMTVEALTGRRPFEGQTPANLLRSLLHETVQIKAAAGGRDLNRALQRCLAKRPDDRYRSVGEMRRELIPAVRNCRAVSLQIRSGDPLRTMTMGN